jgi:hypothetical protein
VIAANARLAKNVKSDAVSALIRKVLCYAESSSAAAAPEFGFNSLKG